MNAAQVCKSLHLTPAYLAEVFKREVAHQHLDLAKQAVSPDGPELGGFALEHISNLLHLIGELEGEHSRQHPEEAQEAWAASRRAGWALGEESGGGAKEATLAATPTSPHRSRFGPGR